MKNEILLEGYVFEKGVLEEGFIFGKNKNKPKSVLDDRKQSS